MPPSASSHDAAGSGSFSSSNSNSNSTEPTDFRAPRTEQELAQAFRDLARGEQTASALEANLTSLESKLDELLASFTGSAGAETQATNGAAKSADGKEGDGARGDNGQDRASK
ncbi:hypothetical protein VM1G_11372 [Cytospora mali]|uniref:Uncharacterized protein n=1 Tax=Cytospora mali TaxID=578113 RepID=A0A194VNN7_CYTMA|nr:hypothetical protein VM1G_11372 [Valsa mali]